MTVAQPPVDPVARALWHLEIGYPEADDDQSCELGCNGCDDCTDYDDDPYPPERDCGYCGGTGGDPWNDYILPCPRCDGEGTTWWL